MQLENIRSKLNASDVLMKKVKSELRGKEDDFNRLQIENKKLKVILCYMLILINMIQFDIRYHFLFD